MFVLFDIASNVVNVAHLIHRLSLQLNKLGRRNKSAIIDLSNANPTCGHIDVLRRTTGHIVVTARHSSEHRDPNRDKTLDRVQPTREHRKLIGVKTISSAANYSSFHCLEYIMLSIFQNLNYKLRREDGLMCSSSTERSHHKQHNK